jgi:hypothetical protein
MSKQFKLSAHAQEEVERRRIPMQLVESVLNNPQQVVPAFRGKTAYQSELDFGSGKKYLLRAIVDDSVYPAAVITVYRTSKINKYWRKG